MREAAIIRGEHLVFAAPVLSDIIAEATAQMQASLGRAARLGERSLGHKDPGAVSACMIIAEFATALG